MLQRFHILVYFVFIFITALAALYVFQLSEIIAIIIALFLAVFIVIGEKSDLARSIERLSEQLRKTYENFYARFRKETFPSPIDECVNKMRDIEAIWNTTNQNMSLSNISLLRDSVLNIKQDCKELADGYRENEKQYFHKLQSKLLNLDREVNNLLKKSIAHEDNYISEKTSKKITKLIKESLNTLLILKYQRDT